MQSRKDSLSRCNQHTGLYDLRNSVRSTDAIEIDTSISDPQILKCIAQNRIWSVIGKILRCLCMALLMPPYVVLYGIPKWIFQKCVPIVSSIKAFLLKQYTKIIIPLKQFICRCIPSKKTLRRVSGVDLTLKYIDKCRCKERFSQVNHKRKAVGESIAGKSKTIGRSIMRRVHQGLAVLRPLPKNTAKIIKDALHEIHQKLPFKK